MISCGDLQECINLYSADLFIFITFVKLGYLNPLQYEKGVLFKITLVLNEKRIVAYLKF